MHFPLRCTPVRVLVPLLVLGAVALAAGCGASTPGATAGTTSGAAIAAVGAENEYANVIEQIGGAHVSVAAIESNPNTDPHTYEASPSVAAAVSEAKLVVQNGVGYDTYMERIEAASPSSSRKVIDVQKLLGLPESTANPHLWYKPTTMPAVAEAVARALSALQPAHAAYFQERARSFDASLQPWLEAIARFAKRYPHVAVATTEPVADYLLEAMGARNLTPFSMQADIMNGTDPAPQDVALQEHLLGGRQVKAFVHNEQVTSSVTDSFVKLAHGARVPIVGVYETMPTPGYDYQSWMLAEVKAIEAAVARGVSTEHL